MQSTDTRNEDAMKDLASLVMNIPKVVVDTDARQRFYKIVSNEARQTGRTVIQYDATGPRAPPLSTVTARRFCDQHEMLSQTATGRSLP